MSAPFGWWSPDKPAEPGAPGVGCQIEQQLSTEARVKVRRLGVDEPVLILAEMPGDPPPAAADEQVAQIAGDKEQLVAPMSRQNRSRTATPRTIKHRPHRTRPIVDARPLRTPHREARRFGIDRSGRDPIDL